MIQATVVIPTFNRVEQLRRVLISLNGQTAGSIFEVVVVDDGSTVDVHGFVKSLPLEYPCKTYWQPHQGFRAAKARNTGILFGEGGVVIFLDDDMVVENQYIETHLRAHAQGIEVVVIGLRHRVPHKLWARPDATLDEWRAGSVPDLRARTFQGTSWKKLPWAFFTTCNASVRRDVLIHGGMFDEGFVGWGLEDSELAYRLHQIGIGFVVLHKPMVYHLEPADHDVTTSGDSYWIPSDKLAAFARNADYFVGKFPDDRGLAILLAREQRLRMLAYRGDQRPQNIQRSVAPDIAVPRHLSLLTPYEDHESLESRPVSAVMTTSNYPSLREELELSFGMVPGKVQRMHLPDIPEWVVVILMSPVVLLVAVLLLVGMVATGRYRRIFRGRIV